jgi:hypothetical protein
MCTVHLMERIMAENALQNLLKYYDNRVIRALIQLVPCGIGSAVDVLLMKTVDNIREQRAKAFFDELSNGNMIVDEALLESEDFLHSYFATAKMALNSRRREKIQMFARLLKSSISGEGPQDSDEYEDFLGILDELSYRELQALAIMDEFSSLPRTEEQNDLTWTDTFWDKFVNRLEEKLKIPSEEVSDFMNRISRTGCYEMFTGSYWDYTGGKGKLTPTYKRLKRYIMEVSNER